MALLLPFSAAHHLRHFILPSKSFYHNSIICLDRAHLPLKAGIKVNSFRLRVSRLTSAELVLLWPVMWLDSQSWIELQSFWIVRPTGQWCDLIRSLSKVIVVPWSLRISIYSSTCFQFPNTWWVEEVDLYIISAIYILYIFDYIYILYIINIIIIISAYIF